MPRINAGLLAAASLLALAFVPPAAGGPLGWWAAARQTVPEAPTLGIPTLGNPPAAPATSAPTAISVPAAPAATSAPATPVTPVAPVAPVAPVTNVPASPAAGTATGTSTDAAGTLWDIISSGAGDPDSTPSDYDLFTRAVRSSTYEGVLKSATTSGATLLAPSDAAFIRTAADLGYSGGDEAGAFNAISQVLASASGGRADALLFAIVGYHIIPGSINADAMAAGRAARTYSGAQVVFQGASVLQVASSLPNPTRVGGQTVASNGILHPIDRLLFPIDIDTAAAAQVANAAVAPGGNGGGEAGANGNGSVVPSGIRTGGASVCFPASARVRLADGRQLPAGALAAGDMLATPAGPSAVFLFTHRQTVGVSEFVRLVAGEHAIALSGAHYVYANGAPVRADAVRRGDVLRTVSGARRVRSVARVWERGLVAPHTLQGDIVVGGVVASTYTDLFRPRVAHAILAPVRAVVVAGVAREPLGSAFYAGKPRREAVAEWVREKMYRMVPMALLIRGMSV